MGNSAATAARPGRQRSEAADQAILAATLDVLAAEGYGGLTMAAVISRAGVSSATLYRRWQTKQHLVAAALASLHAEVVEIDTGSLDTDVAAFLRSLAETMSIRRADLAQEVAVELRRNPDFLQAVNDKFLVPRIEQLSRILEHAGERSELGSIATPVAMSLLSGPLHHRVYVLGEPITNPFLRTAAIGGLAALRAVAPPS